MEGFQKNNNQQHNKNILPISSSPAEHVIVIHEDNDNNNGECSVDVVTDERVLFNNNNNLKPSPKNSSKNTKNVNFALKVRVRETLSLDDYTMEELQNCWYTPEEKKDRALKRERIIARMEAGKPAKGNYMTYRGLEGWTIQGGKTMNERILNCVNAVMDEQDHQWKIDQDDFVRIADTSRTLSSVSKEEALQRAINDRYEALRALKGSWKSTLTSASSSSLTLTTGDQSSPLVVAAKTKNNHHHQRKQRQQSNRGDPPGILLRAA